MNKLASIFFFLFLLFLITPTIISAIENEGDLSVIYSFSEEEQDQKEVKLVCHFDQINKIVYLFKTTNSVIFSINTLKQDEIPLFIFLTPPELS